MVDSLVDLVAFLFCREIKERRNGRDILGMIEGVRVQGVGEFSVLVYTHWVGTPGEYEQRLTLEIAGLTQEFTKRFTINQPLEGTPVLVRVPVRSGPGHFADFRVLLDGQEVSRRVLPILGLEIP